jgi:ribosomal-protein-alanine N-acetyltransferase
VDGQFCPLLQLCHQLKIQNSLKYWKPGMRTLETSRLILDELTPQDAKFILQILNDRDFIHYVADRGIRTEAEARDYLADRVMASYREHGFGMAAVRRKDSGETIGMCGLVKRESLQHVDIGYAFLPEVRGKGYASEAALATVQMAREDFGLSRLVAIIHPDNKPSRALAEKIGMHFDTMIRLDIDEDKICLYILNIS